MPFIFEDSEYEIFAYRRIDNKVVMMDKDFQLVTLNVNSGKILQKVKVSDKFFSKTAKPVNHIRHKD